MSIMASGSTPTLATPAASGVLPANWSEHYDEEGNLYYYNEVTGGTSWDRLIFFDQWVYDRSLTFCL